MSTRIMVAVLALALLGGVGCKKKKDEGTKPAEGTGAMKPSEGTGAMKPPDPPKVEKKEGKDLAAHYLACGEHMNAGKWDEFEKQCAASTFVSHMADMGDQTWAQALEQMKGMRVAFPDMKMMPQLVLVNGRNVFAAALMTGTHTGPLKAPGMAEVPPTNKKVGVMFFHRLAIDDENKATEEWAYMDPSQLFGQLGLLPKEAPVRPAMDKGMDGAPIVVVTADDEKEKKNLEAAKATTAAFKSKKIPDIMATYTDDAVEMDQADNKDTKGKKEIQASTERLFKAFSDFGVVGEPQYFASGDYVVMLGKFEATHDGNLGPIKKTGKKVSGDFAEIMEFKDGKVAKLWRFRNGMAMAMQLGLIPAPGQPAAGGPGETPKAEPMKQDDGAKMKK